MTKVTCALTAAALAGLAGCAMSADRAYGPQLARARSEGAPLLVYAVGVPGQIEIRGRTQTAVPVYVQFIVTTDEPLKRVAFTLAAYTARGYPVRGPHGNSLGMRLIGPGPFDPDGNYEVNSFHSQPAGFPGGDVACVELVGIDIVYANGARDSYDLGSGTLQPALMPPVQSRCGDNGPLVTRMMGGSGS